MILRYLILSIIQVFLMLVQFCFSWLIALSVTKEGHLRFLPSLFEPTDSLAIGDRAYWDNEMSYCMDWPQWIRNYWLALNWGMRNPAYGFADMAAVTLKYAHDFTSFGDPSVDVGIITTPGAVYRTIINGDGKKYFEYRFVRINSAKSAFYIQLGWSISTIDRSNGT